METKHACLGLQIAKIDSGEAKTCDKCSHLLTLLMVKLPCSTNVGNMRGLDTEPSLAIVHCCESASADSVPTTEDVLRAPLGVLLTTAELPAPRALLVTDSPDIGNRVRDEPTACAASAAC